MLDGIKVGLDKRGCLTIKGDITNNELLVTNDIVELLTKTRFKWIGRVDNVINSGGVKVQVEKVELAIAEAFADLTDSPRFFIAPQPDELLGEKVVLILEGTPLAQEDEADLMERLRSKLRKFELPKETYYSPAFSETSTGKLSRQRTLQKLGLFTD